MAFNQAFMTPLSPFLADFGNLRTPFPLVLETIPLGFKCRRLTFGLTGSLVGTFRSLAAPGPSQTACGPEVRTEKRHRQPVYPQEKLHSGPTEYSRLQRKRV